MIPISTSPPALSRCAVFASLFFAFCVQGVVQPRSDIQTTYLPTSGVTPAECWQDYLAGVDRAELEFFYDLRFAYVKFDDRYRVRLREGRLMDVGEESALTLAGLSSTLELLDAWRVRWLRGARDVEEVVIDELRAGAVHPEGRPVPDLNNIYLLQMPEGLRATAVVRELHGLPGIEYVVFVNQAQPVPQSAPCVPDFADVAGSTDTNLVVGAQWYLEGFSTNRPVGVDAFYAWDGFRGDGFGVTVVDVEYNFESKHVDLPNVEILAAPGLGLPQDLLGDHGTAVLGVMGGKNNGFGVRGIAHGATFKFSSEWRKAYDFFGRQTVGVSDRFAAIIQAVAHTQAGDIIVLEMQQSGPTGQLIPAEWDRPVYDATVAAVASGRIVIAAAGNGNANLDQPAFSVVPGWDPGQGPFQAANRSGAIIVGGGVPAGFPDGAGGFIPGLVATATSTFGSRVDLQGWGQFVMTTGYGGIARAEAEECYRPMNLDARFKYTSGFNGTSAATPIVAGAAAVVQGLFKHSQGRPATPLELRNLLVSTGTPQGPGGTIGPLPNLKAAIESLADPAVLNAAPPDVSPSVGPTAGSLLMQLDYSGPGQNFNNTILAYTLDGSDPTVESYRYIPEFDSGVFLRRTVTVKVRTFRRDDSLQRWFGGPVLEGQYNFGNKVPPVRFVSNSTEQPIATGDSVGWPFALRMEADILNANIRYTVGPWDEAGAVAYTGPVSFDAGQHLVVAKAYREGLVASDPAGVLFNVVQYGASAIGGQIQSDPPVVLPVSGVYAGGVTVTMNPSHPLGSVRYTLDGTEPTPDSLLYMEPIHLSASTVVRARTFAFGVLPSIPTSQTYTVLGTPVAPTITPAGGGFLGTQLIRLEHPEPTAVIRYTLGGAEPGVTSTLYTGPLNLSPGTYTLKARAFLENMASSATASAQFTFFDPANAVQPPVILPRLGSQTLIFTLDFEIPTQGAIVYYTINDPDPAGFEVTTADIQHDPANPQQLGSLPGGRDYLIRARAFKDGQPSLQVQKNYTVFWPFDGEGNRLEVADITIEPEPGIYHDTIALTFRTSTSSVQFRYTTDGSTPPESPTTLTGNNQNGAFQPSQSFPINLNRSALVSVAGTRLGYFPSAVAEAEYVLRCGAPLFTAEQSPDGSWEVTISSSTPNATVRYTTDGTDPTNESSVYGEPLLLDAGTHLLQARAFRNNFESSEIVPLMLSVEPAPTLPVITLQPTNVTATAGDTVVLRVEAEGYPPPVYAWKREGIFLGESFSTIELLDVQTSDAATYSVTVSNTVGAVESQEVVLVVNSALTAIEEWRQLYFEQTEGEGDAADDADPDNDGARNADEFLAGTDPTDPDSVLRIRSLTHNEDGTIAIRVSTVEQRVYRLFFSPDLIDWQPLLEEQPGTGADVTFVIDALALDIHTDIYFRFEVNPGLP